MPQNMYKCIICNKEISEKKSLIIEYEGKTRRACKEHQEVIDIIDAKYKEIVYEEIDSKMKVISFVSGIVVANAIYNFSIEYLISRVRSLCTFNEYEQIIAKLKERNVVIPVHSIISSLQQWKRITGKDN